MLTKNKKPRKEYWTLLLPLDSGKTKSSIQEMLLELEYLMRKRGLLHERPGAGHVLLRAAELLIPQLRDKKTPMFG